MMTAATIIRRQLDEIASIVMATDEATYTSRPIAASGSTHQWVDKREISVVMERGDAATVSRTTVEVSSTDITLEYEPLLPLGPPRRFELTPC
jgi:hypothetical protein